MEAVTTAIISFFGSQSGMLDQVPSLGYIPKVFKAMSSRNDAIPKSAIDIAHILATSAVSTLCNVITVTVDLREAS